MAALALSPTVGPFQQAARDVLVAVRKSNNANFKLVVQAVWGVNRFESALLLLEFDENKAIQQLVSAGKDNLAPFSFIRKLLDYLQQPSPKETEQEKQKYMTAFGNYIDAHTDHLVVEGVLVWSLVTKFVYEGLPIEIVALQLMQSCMRKSAGLDSNTANTMGASLLF